MCNLIVSADDERLAEYDNYRIIASSTYIIVDSTIWARKLITARDSLLAALEKLERVKMMAILAKTDAFTGTSWVDATAILEVLG